MPSQTCPFTLWLNRLSPLLLLSACSGEPSLSPTPEPSSTPAQTEPQPVLNEVSCHNDDWVELYNPTQKVITLAGYGLTDDPSDVQRTYTFPAGLQLAPGEFIGVEPAQDGQAGITFGIKCGADSLSLLAPSGEVLETVILPELPESASFGRLPDGTGAFDANGPTLGAANVRFEEPPPPLDIFDLTDVPTVDLTLSNRAIDALYIDPYTYVAGGFRFTKGGLSSESLEVGIRLKSYIGSFQTLDGKAAFKISFNEVVSGQRWEGLKRLTLNNMVQDPSMIHEALSYTAFRAQGLPAPRVGYAWVRVNGTDYGLYTNVETFDDVSLPQWFSSTSHLYEGAYGADVYPGAEYSFEIDEGSETDVSDLTDLIEAANSEDPVWIRRMEALTDLDQLLRFWATELYLGHWDGYPTHNNYYLHADEAGVFSMLPWGTDQTLNDHRSFMNSDGLMFKRCVAIPECYSRYISAVRTVAEEVEALKLENMLDSLVSTLKPFVHQDPRNPYAVEDVSASQSSTREFLLSRSSEATSWIECVLYDNCAPCLPLELESGYYELCTVERTWQEAQGYCEKLGLSLLSLSSGDEERLLAEAALSYGQGSVWLGANDLEEEGVWRWADGSPVLYTHWGAGEPNNSGEEDCAELVTTGYWNDLPCSVGRASVCEAPCTDETDQDGDGFSVCTGDCNDQDPQLAPDRQDVCDDGVDQDCSGVADDGAGCSACKQVVIGDQNYRVCQQPQSFDEAVATCQSLDMQLATPQDELSFQGLWSAVAESQGVLEVWFGLTDVEEEGSWRWLEGEPTSYQLWAPGQPDNAGEEDCAGTFSDGSWNDYPCWYPLGAVCEA
ncbi:MAG: CotH kinase family protein, partial [Myxococcota bacterium]